MARRELLAAQALAEDGWPARLDRAMARLDQAEKNPRDVREVAAGNCENSAGKSSAGREASFADRLAGSGAKVMPTSKQIVRPVKFAKSHPVLESPNSGG